MQRGGSFTDCTSFAVMDRARIDRAFTFDRPFRQYGFVTLPGRPPRGSMRHPDPQGR